MPRFFFHIDRQDSIITDEEGSELPNLHVAQREALVSLRQLVTDVQRGKSVVDVARINVADATGQVLAVVLMEDAVQSLQ